MTVQYKEFFKNQSTARISAVLVPNIEGNSLLIQVYGTGTYSIEVRGKTGKENVDNYAVLSGFSTSYSIVNAIIAQGIYTYSVSGISGIVVEIKSITGGAITVHGSITGD